MSLSRTAESPEALAAKNMMMKVWEAMYTKVLREPTPRSGKFKEYTDIKLVTIDQQEGYIPPDIDNNGKIVPGAAEVHVRALTYSRAPTSRVINSFRIEVSTDGLNYTEYEFMYGQRMKEGINRHGNAVYEPEITEKIYIGQSSHGKLIVDGRYREKIAFLDLHPYNADSPIWWGDDPKLAQRFEAAGFWLRSLHPYNNKSCCRYGCEYTALKEEEEMNTTTLRASAAQMVLETRSEIKLKNALTQLGITIPPSAQENPYKAYRGLLFEYANVHPKEVMDLLWGPRPAMLEIVELAFRCSVLRFRDGSVTTSDGNDVAWLQPPSDLAGLSLHEYVVNTVIEKTQSKWFEDLGFEVKRATAKRNLPVPEIEDDEADDEPKDLSAKPDIEARVWKMVQDGKFKRKSGYWCYKGDKVEGGQVALGGSNSVRVPVLYDLALSDPEFFEKYPEE